jgi:hypothetical protein
MSTEEAPKIPRAQIVYGEIVYWITIAACIICMIGPVLAISFSKNNVLDPHYLFAAIFQGKNAQAIWKEVGGGFPGGHFYLRHFTLGDGFTQFGLALGCSVALWGLIAAAIAYFAERIYTYSLLAIWVTLLVLLSMTGIVAGH